MKKDALKIILDLYKGLIFSFLTALFACLGYGFVNFENLAYVKLYALLCICVALLIILCILFLFFLGNVKKID